MRLGVYPSGWEICGVDVRKFSPITESTPIDLFIGRVNDDGLRPTCCHFESLPFELNVGVIFEVVKVESGR